MANDIIDIIVTDNSDNVQLNVTPNLVSINVSQTSGNIIGSNYFLASTFGALPITGDTTTLYVINDTSLMYRWSGSAYTQINSSAVVAWGQITGALSGQTDLQNALNAKAPLASPTFTGTVSGITKAMVGLSNVDNTSDVNKPVSSATQTALDFKANIASPTFTGTVGGITKAMVGLGNVDNTTDLNKPISTATQSSLDTKAPIASPTFTGTVSGITKSMVGLGNVDNTTDLLKPISTATQSALNLKYDASNPSGYTTNVGTVTSVGGTGTVSGLSLSGSVTTSGNLTLGGTLSLTSGNVTTALGYTPYNATNPSGYISGITSGQVTTALGYTPENSANKGIANGYASLDGGGLVPSTQLPSYVDDVLEFADLAAFPASGTTGKIYVALDTNKIYRWSGATYIEVSPTVGTIWGGITGTLSNQTDLQNALNTKQNNLSGTGFVKSTAGTISYDTATYYPYPTGDTTQYVGGDGSLISFPVAGQSGTIVRLIRNNTGATLTKGTVIYISGATGNNPVVSKAIATGDATSAQTFGLCQANIANNATGYVVVMGDLIGLDTSAFTEGQQVYLSGTVAGTFTATKQYAPNHLVYIGVITRSHPTLGQIEVKIQNGYELDEIHDVSIISEANNEGLFYESSTNLWKNKSIATILGYTPSNDSLVVHLAGTETITGQKTFNPSVTAASAIARGTNLTPTLVASANDDSLIGLDINPTFTVGGFINVQKTGIKSFAKIVATASESDIYAEAFTIISNSSGGAFYIKNSTNTTFYSGFSMADSNVNLRFANYVSTGKIFFTANGSDRMTLHPSGNFLINSTTDAGYRLDVNGTFRQTGSVTASSALAQGIIATPTLVASANSDVLVGLDINPTFTNGAFTNVSNIGLRVTGNSTINQISFNPGLTITGGTNPQIRTLDGTVHAKIQSNSGSGLGLFGMESNHPLGLFTNNIKNVQIFTTGNLVLQNGGTFTDAGYRLDVAGTARVSGAVAFSSSVSINTTNVVSTLEIGSAESDGTASTNAIRIQSKTGASNQQLLIGINQTGTYSFLQSSQASVGYKSLSLNPNGGNVGIGTTTPDVTGFGWTTLTIRGGTTSGSAGVLELQTPATNANGQNIGVIAFLDGTNRNAQISVSRDTSTSTANVLFYTNAGAGLVERMRITSGGWTKISNDGTYTTIAGTVHEIKTTLANQNILYLGNTSNTSPYGPYIEFPNAAPNNATNYFLGCGDNAVARFILRSNGGLANYAANDVNLSDIRTKKDILPLGSYWDKFKAIEIVKFKYKDQSHDDYNIGVISQQVESVAPEFVDIDGFGTTPEDGIPLKSIYTADLYHTTIKVLQEAMDKIEELSAKVTLLENK